MSLKLNKVLSINVQIAWWTYILFFVSKLFLVDNWLQTQGEHYCMQQKDSYGMGISNAEWCGIYFTLIAIVFLFFGWYSVLSKIKHGFSEVINKAKIICFIFGGTALMTSYRNFSNDHIVVTILFLYVSASLWSFLIFYKNENSIV